MLNQTELKALINLLDDPDENVFIHVKEKLLTMGQEVIPVLEHVWEMGDPFNQTVQTRIENIIHKIQYDTVTREFVEWATDSPEDLLKGVLLVSKYQFPDLDQQRITSRIDQIRQDVWLELSENLTGLEKIRILNHIIFEVHGFRGNTEDFHGPQNGYINQVLESKKGNPLSLGILYLIIAQKLNIPVSGVDLPEHFIIAYQGEEELLKMVGKEEMHGVLFYINPFSNGAIFSKKEIDGFLSQLGIEPEDKFYEPCSNFQVVIRLVKTLVRAYEKQGYPKKQEELTALLDALTARGFTL